MKNGRNILKDGTIKYYNGNLLHRHNGPAVIRPNGATEWWIKGNQLKVYNNQIAILRQPYFNNENKKIKQIMLVLYIKNNVLHRDSDKPAFIAYHLRSNSIKRKIYYKNGLIHRLTGPAFEVRNNENVKRTKKGKLTSSNFDWYYIDDVRVSKNDFENNIKVKLAKLLQENKK